MKRKSKKDLISGEEKKKLRSRVLSHRKNLSSNAIKKISSAIDEKLRKLELYKSSKNIMFFVSKEGEIDTVTIIKRDIGLKNIFVPKVSGKKLEVYRIKDFERDLSMGKFGILEPNKNAVRKCRANVDLVIVPALVFDRQGHRLGYGQGYYDRFLSKIRAEKRVGVIYSEYLVDRISREPHDVPVRTIVTEKGVVKIEARDER